MTDNTNKELRVEVPTKFDAEGAIASALLQGLQKALETFVDSYQKHDPSKELVISVPKVSLVQNEVEKEFPLSDVVEDTNTDK